MLLKNLDDNRGPLGLAVVSLFFVLATVPVNAQQITGTPGSPSTTTTLSGEQLPPMPQKLGVGEHTE
jgi:arylsulfatase